MNLATPTPELTWSIVLTDFNNLPNLFRSADVIIEEWEGHDIVQWWTATAWPVVESIPMWTIDPLLPLPGYKTSHWSHALYANEGRLIAVQTTHTKQTLEKQANNLQLNSLNWDRHRTLYSATKMRSNSSKIKLSSYSRCCDEAW